MVDVKVLSNGKIRWGAGPSSAIANARWVSGPTLAELQSLTNVSAAVKIDGTDFGLEASDQSDDRSFADAAGSQARSFSQASGNIEIYTPAKGEVSGINVTAWDILSKTRTKLAIAQRFVKSQSSAIVAGDEVNVFRVITDDRIHNRNDVSRTLGIGLVLQDDLLVNYIVPSAVPTAPAISPSGAITLTVGTPSFRKVSYEGRNITVGAKYVSSNEAVFTVTPHGILIPVAAGTATLTVSYPGAAALAPISVTVS